MNIFYWCVEYIAGFTEAFLCVVFCGIFIDREKLKKQRFKVFMLSIMMGMISILFTFFDLFSIYNSFAILVCFCVFLMIFYKKYISGLLTCIFLMIVVAIDSISVGMLSLSINTNYNELFEKFSYSRVICTMFSKSLLILIISSLSKFFNKSSRLSKKYTIIISVYSVLLLTINYFTFMINADIRSSETTFLLLPFFVISLITVLLLFYFAIKISDYYEKNQELRLVRIRNKMLQSSLDETQQIFNLWKKSIHDYKNQIILLEELASANDIEKIKHYLLQEKELLSSKVFYIKTGNSAVDAIINTKIKIAEQKKIKFCVNAQINGFCGVDDFDLASILGNLIDNAIEASVTEEEPYIEIVIKIQKSFLIIKSINKYTKELFQYNTEKQNSEFHGIGLKSIKYVVNKYDGEFEIHKEDNLVIASVILNCSCSELMKNSD